MIYTIIGATAMGFVIAGFVIGFILTFQNSKNK